MHLSTVMFDYGFHFREHAHKKMDSKVRLYVDDPDEFFFKLICNLMSLTGLIGAQTVTVHSEP